MEKKKNQRCSWVPELPPDLCEGSNTYNHSGETGWPVIEDNELYEKYLNDAKRFIPQDASERIMLCKPDPTTPFISALIQALRSESVHVEEVKGIRAFRWVPEHIAVFLIQQAYYLGIEDYNKAQSLAKERKRQHP